MEINKNNTATIEHLVFFWLKNPDNKENIEQFEASLKKLLNTSVYAKNGHLGKPAPTNRPVIDNSYTFLLKVTFNNIEEHDKYQTEPAHLSFLAESKHLWEKVLIYDSESIL